MDWTVYWFQSIACFFFAAVAMFSGITGAALMLSWFIMGFAVLGVPQITTQQAIASALFLETAAFTIGIYRYWQRHLIDVSTAKRLAIAVFPAAVLGALVSHRAPETALRITYSIMMAASAWLLLKRGDESRRRRHQSCPSGEHRDLTEPGGARYRFCIHGLRLQRAITGGGAFLTGLISTGVGEVTVPPLILRSGVPVPVAAATSIALVAVADSQPS